MKFANVSGGANFYKNYSKYFINVELNFIFGYLEFFDFELNFGYFSRIVYFMLKPFCQFRLFRRKLFNLFRAEEGGFVDVKKGNNKKKFGKKNFSNSCFRVSLEFSKISFLENLNFFVLGCCSWNYVGSLYGKEGLVLRLKNADFERFLKVAH